MSRKGFSGDEVAILLSIVEKHKAVIECKRSDSISTNRKDLVWMKISEEFCAQTAVPREAKDLKKKYANLKYVAKQKAAAVRQNTYSTGGGPPITTSLNAVEEKVINMLHRKETEGISCMYDNDTADENIFNEYIEKDDVEMNESAMELGTTMRKHHQSTPLRTAKQPEQSTDLEFGSTMLKQKKSTPLRNANPRKQQKNSWQRLADLKKKVDRGNQQHANEVR